MNKSREIVFAGLFIAMGLILPIIFHTFTMGGPAFLPMHIPVLIAGLLLSPKTALFVGIITPILSSVLTGMPPVYPMLPIMIFELATYGFVAALCSRKFYLGLYPSMFIAMIAGRIMAGLVVAVLAFGFGFPTNPIPYVYGAIMTGIPGIIIQILVVPAFAKLISVLGIRTSNA